MESMACFAEAQPIHEEDILFWLAESRLIVLASIQMFGLGGAIS